MPVMIRIKDQNLGGIKSYENCKHHFSKIIFCRVSSRTEPSENEVSHVHATRRKQERNSLRNAATRASDWTERSRVVCHRRQVPLQEIPI